MRLLHRLVAHQDGNLERKISLTVPEDQSQPPSSAVKELSRRQLKDLLTDVYASKARTDRRHVGFGCTNCIAGLVLTILLPADGPGNSGYVIKVCKNVPVLVIWVSQVDWVSNRCCDESLSTWSCVCFPLFQTCSVVP